MMPTLLMVVQVFLKDSVQKGNLASAKHFGETKIWFGLPKSLVSLRKQNETCRVRVLHLKWASFLRNHCRGSTWSCQRPHPNMCLRSWLVQVFFPKKQNSFSLLLSLLAKPNYKADKSGICRRDGAGRFSFPALCVPGRSLWGSRTPPSECIWRTLWEETRENKMIQRLPLGKNNCWISVRRLKSKLRHCGGKGSDKVEFQLLHLACHELPGAELGQGAEASQGAKSELMKGINKSEG